ncbi:MAG: hypothetical protein FWD37_05395 [Methanomassiliicoccaceae archaeon]|nr:hypothetical protein [Methanomassiliicoccaceae archaeon]
MNDKGLFTVVFFLRYRSFERIHRKLFKEKSVISNGELSDIIEKHPLQRREMVRCG